MEKFPTNKSNNIKDNMHFWVKQYLAYKIQTFFETSKKNSIDDIVVLKDEILSSKDFAQTKTLCSSAINQGLKSLYRVLHGVTNFYSFAVDNVGDIESINDKTIEVYRDSLDVADSTAKGYIDVAIELLTFIENKNSDNFKFNIEYKVQRTKKARKKVRDAMNNDEFKLFNKKIAEYDYKGNEFARARDVMIIRFILLCGLKPNEVMELKLGDSLIFNESELYLKLDNRKENIPIPRKLFIRFLNKYLELKENNKDGYFFYGVRNKDEQISVKYIHRLIETMLEYSGIHKRESDAEMLRTSLAVYLYNNRAMGSQIVINTIQNIMGHTTLSQTRDMIGFHDANIAIVSDVFEKDLIE